MIVRPYFYLPFRTYTSARYYTDAEILDILTGKEGR